MTVKKFIKVRRLYQSEADLIREIQDEKTGQANFLKFKGHYLNHVSWVEKTIDEIREGKKIAFGAFLPNLKGSRQEFYSAGFVGSVIIKKGLSGEIEIKNLLSYPEVISERDEDNNLINVLIKSCLIEKVEAFCVEKGFKKLIYEVPSSETDDINFLLTHKYKLLTAFESKYHRNDYFYIFSKNLMQSYGGDPYDFSQMVRTVLVDYFQFTNISENPSIESERISETDVEISALYFNVQSDAVPAGLELKGQALIAISLEDSRQVKLNSLLSIFKKEMNLRILITDLPMDVNEHDSVKIITWSTIESLFAFKRPLLSKYYRRNKICSFLININSERNYSRIVADRNKTIVAAVFDGMGRFFEQIALSGKDLTVFLYSSSENGASSGGIWAICRYKHLITRSRGAIYEEYKDRKDVTFLDDSLFNFNSSYNDKTDVNAFELELLSIREQTMDISPALTKEASECLVNDEFYEVGIPNTYLDEVSTNRIIKLWNEDAESKDSGERSPDAGGPGTLPFRI